jgi:pilus assembly protein CpaC
MKGFRYVWFYLAAAFIVGAVSVSLAVAQVEEKIDTREKRDVILYKGDLVSLKVYSLTRIAISTPGIVDIVNADVDEILLVGNALGQTQIFIWDEYGKRSVLARVMEQDLDMIKERIEQLLNSAGIAGVKMENSAYEAKIIATGKVNKSQKDLFDKVIADFGAYVINMVDAQGDLIQIDAQITELSKTLTEVLGVNWGANSEGQAESRAISLTESGTPASGIRNAFRVVNMDRTNAIAATVNAMLDIGEAKHLSRPSLVLSDGETATITVGGEVPVKTSQFTGTATGGDAVSTETITYKQYGLTFSVTAEIKDNEKVDVTLNVNINDLDATTGSDGGVLTTSTQTKVLLNDGQTIIIAGLIKKSEIKTETKFPFLSSIPILGMLFRNKSTSVPDREIVISLTANIRRQRNNLKTVKELEENELVKERAFQAKGTEAAMNETIDETDKMSADLVQSMTDVPDPFLEQDLDAVLSGVEKAARQEVFLKETGEVSSVITDYAKGVQQKIAQRISFPFAAKENGWDGVVVLSLKILSDGQLNDVFVKESSGRSIFDSDAVNTAKIVAPYAPFPVEMEMDEVTVSIPVTYSQEAFLIK